MEPSRRWGDDRAILDDDEARARLLDAAARCIVRRGDTAIRMAEAGVATVEDIDTAVVAGLSHPMGPLRLCDLIGLDTMKLIADSMFEEYKEPLYAPPPLLSRMVEAGQLGKNISTEEGKAAARAIAIDLMGTLHAAVGDLNRVTRIVKVMSLVNSTADYTEQHLVTNGASELLGEVFGDAGKHARSAFGVAQLPMGSCVEIEMVAELEPDPHPVMMTADPYVVIRPEGRWHVPGILELSASREATNLSVKPKRGKPESDKAEVA